jgi:Leucine-rich repeat (LRR) protein
MSTTTSPYGDAFQAATAAAQRRSRVRRTLWVLFLVMLVFGIGLGVPFWMHLRQLAERRAWEDELWEYVWLHYIPTDTALALRQSSWVPSMLSDWYDRRSQAVAQMDFTKLKGRALPPHLADRIMHSEWPYLMNVYGFDWSFWDGKRWLLPKHAGKVQSLRFSNCGFTDEMLSAFPVWSAVRMVNLDNNPIGDRGMSYLSQLPQLSHLDLSGTKVTDQGLSALTSCPWLDYLSLRKVAIDGSGLKHLRGAYRLSTLKLSETPVRDEQLRQLPHLPELSYLELSGTKLNGSGLAWEWEPKSLEQLTLINVPIRSEHLIHFKRFVGLKILDLSGPAELNEGIGHLRSLRRLTTLNLNGTNLSDAGLNLLVGSESVTTGDGSTPLPSLQHLSIGQTQITDAAAPAIRRLESLSTLTLWEAKIGDKFIAGLAGHPSLTALYLSKTQVTDACLPSLLAIPKLNYLDVRETKISESVLKELKQRGMTIHEPTPPPQANYTLHPVAPLRNAAYAWPRWSDTVNEAMCRAGTSRTSSVTSSTMPR